MYSFFHHKHKEMDYKTNPWDIVTAMIGGATFTTWLGNQESLEFFMKINLWSYSTEVLLFAFKAALGGLVAIFFKKMGEDIYTFTKKRLFKKKKK